MERDPGLASLIATHRFVVSGRRRLPQVLLQELDPVFQQHDRRLQRRALLPEPFNFALRPRVISHFLADDSNRNETERDLC